MKLSSKIIYLRKKKNISQQILCDELNVSRQTISKWENGLALPSDDHIQKLADYFQVDFDYLKDDSQDYPIVTGKKNKIRLKRFVGVILIIIGIISYFLFTAQNEKVEVLVHQFDGIGDFKSVEIVEQDEENIYLKLNYKLKKEPIKLITIVRNNEDCVYDESQTVHGSKHSLSVIPKEVLELQNTIVFQFTWWKDNQHIIGEIYITAKGNQTIMDYIENKS